MSKKKGSTPKKPNFEDELEQYIKQDKREPLPLKHAGASIGRPLNPMRLAEYRKCKDCKEHPLVEICFRSKQGKIGKVTLCSNHWAKLADAQIGWESSTDKEEAKCVS